MFISAPALIQQINLLEKDLGFTLLKRSNKGIALTSVGEIYYRGCKKILEDYSAMVSQCRKNSLLDETALRLGAYSSVLLASLRSFSKKYPSSAFRYTNLNNSQMPAVLKQLADDEYDMIFGEKLPEQYIPEGISFQPLRSSPVVCMVKHNHPLLNGSTIGFEELAVWNVYSLSSVCGLTPYIKEIRKKIPLRECNDDLNEITQICEEGGVLLLEEKYAHEEFSMPTIPLRIHLPVYEGVYYAVSNSSPAVSQMLEYLLSAFADN